MTLQTEKYARKPFYVDAVQVTEGNMQDVAKWCQGSVQSTDAGENFIKVRVHRPLNERQTKAFVNDWILFAGTGYKVYTPKAFNQSFEPAAEYKTETGIKELDEPESSADISAAQAAWAAGVGLDPRQER